QVCGESEEKGTIVLCDGCDAEYHIACCSPPLSRPPVGDWHCLPCQSKRGEPV
ncbi:unnamed protein product, partial [Choristocarpus tenellus]